jgi:hypothetical protein
MIWWPPYCHLKTVRKNNLATTRLIICNLREKTIWQPPNSHPKIARKNDLVTGQIITSKVAQKDDMAVAR